jgi:hypothetical protein
MPDPSKEGRSARGSKSMVDGQLDVGTSRGSTNETLDQRTSPDGLDENERQEGRERVLRRTEIASLRMSVVEGVSGEDAATRLDLHTLRQSQSRHR